MAATAFVCFDAHDIGWAFGKFLHAIIVPEVIFLSLTAGGFYCSFCFSHRCFEIIFPLTVQNNLFLLFDDSGLNDCLIFFKISRVSSISIIRPISRSSSSAISFRFVRFDA